MHIENYDVTVLLLNRVVSYPVPNSVNIIDLRKRSPFHIPLCFILLVYHLIKLKPTIVVSVWSFPSLLTGIALWVANVKTKWLPRIANSPADEEFGLRKRVFNFLYKRAVGFIVLCEELQNEFEAHYPFAINKTYLIRNGFDLDELNHRAVQKSEDIILPIGPYIISVGSLKSQKRHDVLLKAYAALDRNSRPPLMILGEGPLRGSLQKLAKQLGIENDVIFKGFVTNPYPYVKNAELFVLASDYEGLCNAAIEAQCLGIPAVITACPTGNREIVEEGVTGMLSPIGDPKILSKNIELLLSDNLKLAAMGESAKKLISNKYRIEVSAKKFDLLLKKLVS